MSAVPMPEAPARRRRHARLIASATRLVAECAKVASGIYDPISEADPPTKGVPVNLWPLAALQLRMPEVLARAHEEDAARWPSVVVSENEESRRAFERRRVLAEAEAAMHGEETVPAVWEVLGTAGQAASVGVGGDFLETWDQDPAGALDLMRSITAAGEYTVGEVLDDAVDTALLAAQLQIARAGKVADDDPSQAAELVLAASRSLVTAVHVASMDLDGLHDPETREEGAA